MISYESYCNGCPECHHCGRNVEQKIVICDKCKDDTTTVYKYNGKELCIDCIIEKYEEQGEDVCSECGYYTTVYEYDGALYCEYCLAELLENELVPVEV